MFIEGEEMLATEEMRTAYYKKFGAFEPDEEVVRWWNSIQRQHPMSKEYRAINEDRMPADAAELTYGKEDLLKVKHYIEMLLEDYDG